LKSAETAKDFGLRELILDTSIIESKLYQINGKIQVVLPVKVKSARWGT